MKIDPFVILTTRISFRSLGLLALLAAYVAFSLFLFFQWVNPSLDGRTDQSIAADSMTYIYFADSIREGEDNPYVLASLYTFPNTLWAPVLLALALKSNFAIVIIDYVMFFASFLLLKKSFSFSAGAFVGLLLLNPTTTISLLSVNKEIIDMLAISLFLYSLRTHRSVFLFVSLMLALVNRYEVCAVMLVFLLAESRLNPLRQRRFMTVAALVIALDVLLPLFASNALSVRFEEASRGGVVTWLDTLEMHYLYIIAVVPKIAENLFGQLFNPSAWRTYSVSDLANSYILWFNNLAYAIVFIVLAGKRLLTMRSNIVYLSILGASLMAVSLVIQPRYFYFIYVLLCLQAARPTARKPAQGYILNRHPREVANA